MEKNKLKESVYLIGFVILFLLSISFIPGGKELAGVKIKKVDILSDLKEKDKNADQEYEYEYNPEGEYWNQINFFPTNKAGFSGLIDLFTSETPDRTGTNVYQPNTKKEKITGNVTQLKPFIDAVKHAGRVPVRIAHFGDSIIGGDLITMDLRDHLQAKFGGNSLGFVSVTSSDANFRLTTKQEFEKKNWNVVSYDRNIKKLPVGIDGLLHTPKFGASVSFTVTPHYSRLNNYNTVRIFYSDAKDSEIKYSFDGGPKESVKLKTGKGLQETVIKASGRASSVSIDAHIQDQANFYGFSIEDGSNKGVIVDNFSFQGKTGEKLDRIPLDILKDFNNYLDYKLVVFQFGLNVIDKIKKDPKGYEDGMVSTITHFQKAMPKAGFILVTVNDKGFKEGTKIITDPNVKLLLGVQQSIAKRTNIAFWNLFEAMGGEESMQNWVRANPPLASSDYTHFNLQGAKMIAEMFSEAIIDAAK